MLCWWTVVSSLVTKRSEYRSSYPEVFLGKGVLKICSKLFKKIYSRNRERNGTTVGNYACMTVHCEKIYRPLIYLAISRSWFIVFKPFERFIKQHPHVYPTTVLVRVVNIFFSFKSLFILLTLLKDSKLKWISSRWNSFFGCPGYIGFPLMLELPGGYLVLFDLVARKGNLSTFSNLPYYFKEKKIKIQVNLSSY